MNSLYHFLVMDLQSIFNVTNFNGKYKLYAPKAPQSLWEVILLTFPVGLETFIATVTASLIIRYKNENAYLETTARFLIEFIVIVISLIFGLTILGEYKVYLYIVLSTISLVLIMFVYGSTTTTDVQEVFDYGRRFFVTNIRATINLITAIAMLGAETGRFLPLKYKENFDFGYSLMDVGVGLYVFSSGIVAPRMYKKHQYIHKSIIDNTHLFVIGIARYFILKLFKSERVYSEFGLHWNFFITLALVKIMSSIVIRLLNNKYLCLAAVHIICIHQFLLEHGLKDWVLMTQRRNDFLTENRAGICSLFGYVSLHLLSLSVGKLFVVKYGRLGLKSDLKLIVRLSISFFVLLYLTVFLEFCFGISQKLANIGYVTWVLCLGVGMSLMFVCAENISRIFYRFKIKSTKFYTPLIYEAINYNGLVFFLVANISTDFIRFNYIKEEYPEYLKDVLSLTILELYMFANCLFITFLNTQKINTMLIFKTICRNIMN